MPVTTPKIVLRIGSFAEKEYFEKLAPKLDSVIFGGNLLEIAPTATASFLALLKEKRGANGVAPYFLDPITFCFGAYIDPETGLKREDLQALKSERIKNRKTKERFTAVKDSYTALAHQLGEKFATAVNDGDTCTAIDPATISASERDAFCQGVLDYQRNRIAQVINAEVQDVVMRDAFDGIGPPAALFAPYFYIHEDWAEQGLDAAMDLVTRSVVLSANLPVHAVLCLNRPLLTDTDSINLIKSELPKTKAAGVWLWFDGLDECDHVTSAEEAIGLRQLVKHLAQSMEVYNLHGGYFSLLLAHDGLTGISHGVGYGERKPVAQVIGEAAPTVRYYLPAIRKRAGVPDIQRCFPDAPSGVGVKTVADFFNKVCDCTICKGVIGDNVRRFAKFGEMHRAKAESKRDTQTPTAAKICRFHFLLRRFAEKDHVATIAADDRAAHIRDIAAPWRKLYPMKNYIGEPHSSGYLENWSQAFNTKI